MTKSFSHLNSSGSITMVDVGAKSSSTRKAVVGCSVLVSSETMELLKQQALPKGDVLTTAQVAGILAAKKTSELIPLCHPIFLDYVDVRFEIDDKNNSINIEAEAGTSAKTGVEMEAMVAAQVAALTIYDMCKAVQKDIKITNCRLLLKTGGKSGTFSSE